jgi:NADH:ubiquinone oxidoreductase subunit 5 (subunit L)/multisubunit Na+/H+ antiporter MnhA subunit
LLGIIISFIIYTYELRVLYYIKKSKLFKICYNFFSRKWYFDRIYNQIIGQNLLNLGYFLSYQYLDRGLLEKFGPFASVFIINRISTMTRLLQNSFMFVLLSLTQTFILFFILYISFQNSFIHFENLLNEYLFSCLILVILIDTFLTKNDDLNNN